ncbi:beta-ketoacyl synthase N-terminal-like domain-containing protein [Streptomyces sedi]|uniref:3-oxoacyl-ACP synthase n=1 Tax=Streptomyces sedi TaxID=555059 RepID=A0A5C4V8H3_9ACTN|nr:beta-ketoacyl synthase N-terminal-like domain-containing protein [Streptomyces sedi]TNM32194.1 3-oxoacyl-ACP synthase [Streptomyces sedi]
MTASVVVTGAAVLLPGADSLPALLTGPAAGGEPPAPAGLVGKKGLRYKDRATQLGYCLAVAALRDAGLVEGEKPTGTTVPAESVGVVASSNYGNLDTVARALDTIREETVTGTSPMDLPNASSNVIASSIAIRYQLRGPNLMVCNGATSGLDAVRWAATMIRAGRVSRVLVLGVEPDNEVVRRLLDGRRAVDGGAAVVLEAAEAAAERGVAPRAVLGRQTRAGDTAAVLERLSGDEARWLGPEAGPGGDAPAALPVEAGAALPEHSGRASGALGVLQLATAVGWFDEGAVGRVVALAGTAGDDASAGLELIAPGAP